MHHWTSPLVHAPSARCMQLFRCALFMFWALKCMPAYMRSDTHLNKQLLLKRRRIAGALGITSIESQLGA